MKIKVYLCSACVYKFYVNTNNKMNLNKIKTNNTGYYLYLVVSIKRNMYDSRTKHMIEKKIIVTRFMNYYFYTYTQQNYVFTLINRTFENNEIKLYEICNVLQLINLYLSSTYTCKKRQQRLKSTIHDETSEH